MSLLNNWAKSEAMEWMLREILGNLVEFLAALSIVSFLLHGPGPINHQFNVHIRQILFSNHF